MRVAAVSYLNTVPMVWGLSQRLDPSRVQLTLAVPSVCAQLFHEKRVDVALLPIGALLSEPQAQLLDGYCIGTNGAVESVCIYSHVPIQQVQRLYLDPDSRTSTLLARVLLERYWACRPQLLPLQLDRLEQGDAQDEAVLLIGDKVFTYRHRYEHTYDLGEAWRLFTGLPMVFAVWAAHTMPATDWLEDFRAALAYGIAHIAEALTSFALPAALSPQQATDYLRQRIDYTYDAQKKEALARYQEEVMRLPDHLSVAAAPLEVRS